MKRSEMKRYLGFTILEWMIALTIIVILAALAVPSYLHHVKKKYYSEVVRAGNTYKKAVALCVEKNKGVVSKCNGGQYGIPRNIVSGKGIGQVDSIVVTNAVITVRPRATNGIKTTDTYILTPIYSPSKLIWKISGGACLSGYVAC